MKLLVLPIIFMQIWDVCDSFGCCPIAVPCIPIRCRPCVPYPCPPPLPPPICPPPPPPPLCPPPPVCPPPPPPVTCPPLPPPCPPPVICPPPPPPVICPPLPPPCPPRPICPPPTVCPPPIICPPPPTLPPPPPQTFPPCPPSPIYPLPEAPKHTYTTPVINDCCCTCVTSCVYTETRIHGAKIFSASLADLERDAKCNDPVLKSIMEENMVGDVTLSKRDIQRHAEKKLFKKFNVICSENDFSYIAYTDTFCQHSTDEITCYAFSPLPEI